MLKISHFDMNAPKITFWYFFIKCASNCLFIDRKIALLFIIMFSQKKSNVNIFAWSILNHWSVCYKGIPFWLIESLKIFYGRELNTFVKAENKGGISQFNRLIRLF